MTKEDIVTKVRALGLPKDSYIVFGSCPLAAVGIRESNDIDMLVSEQGYEQLKNYSWQQLI